jgi:hypothetical protein
MVYMKKIILFSSFLFIVTSLNAQPPEAFKYQAVVRDAGGDIVSDQLVGIKINIRNAIPAGTIIYQETHTPVTNLFGLVNLEIGNGAPTIGTFDGINWQSESKFLEVLIDPLGGINYVSMGTSELQSVPYALFSKNSSDSYWNKSGNNIYYDLGNIGIGITNPAQALDIYSKFQINNNGNIVKLNNVTTNFPSANAAGVLTNNGSGALTWSPAGSSSWALTGNTGTNPATNFIGTTDNVALVFKTNGNKAGLIDPGGNTGNTSYGYQTFNSLSTGADNTATGYQALFSITTGISNTALGRNALLSNTKGNFNTAIGGGTLGSNSTAGQNIAIGTDALNLQDYYNNNTAWNSDNVAVGFLSLVNNYPDDVSNGIQNTAIGNYSLQTNITGYHNTAVGYGADVSYDNLTNATAIGYMAKVGASNSLILGGTGDDAVRVGIGTTTPSSTLSVGASSQFQVNSTGNIIKINNVTTNFPAANSSGVLTNNGSGTLTWAAIGSSWSLTGNAGTVDGTNFIGTTDNIPFNIKVNNQKAGRIDLMYNTFFGYQSCNAYTTGAGNTAIGDKSLYGNETGSFNTGIGRNSLYSNVAGDGATAIGYRAMQYANNSPTSFTSYNVAVGYEALRGSSTASNNTGSRNSAIGYQTLLSNITGEYNTACGMQALYANTTGIFNTSLGYRALYSNTEGSYNTAIGLNALTENLTGSNNTALGYFAGYLAASNTSGTGNTFIGNYAGPNADGLSNATALGFGAIARGSNKVQIGNIFVDGLYFGTSNNLSLNVAAYGNMWYNTTTGEIQRMSSSKRYKTGITDLEINTSKIYNLRAVSYSGTNDEVRYFGLIAEEVAEVMPELAEFAREKDVIKGSTSDKLIPDAVKYPLLSVLLLNEVQKHEKIIIEQQKQIERLDEENTNLKSQISILKSDFEERIKAIEKVVGDK